MVQSILFFALGVLASGSWVDPQLAAAETLKRVLPPVRGAPVPSLDRITAFVETKTVWHTKAML